MIVVGGASGAGKSAVRPELTRLLPAIAWHEFDSVGVPNDPDTGWRPRTLETWVQRAYELETIGHHFGLCGQVAYGELLACPTAPRLAAISYCLLDCSDPVRIARLRAANRPVDQDTLNWAAWLRVHAINPQWRPDVITDGTAPDFAWDRWSTWTAEDPSWQVDQIDTTHLTVREVAKRLADWAGDRLENPTNPVAEPYDSR